METRALNIRYLTFTLTLIAGFCDTLTYFAADNIFSAHVTGNFVVFAYQLIKGADNDAWIKLLTLPVFMCAAALGGWIAQRFTNRYFLFYFAGIALLIAGTIAHSVGHLSINPVHWSSYLITFIVVCAMGLQNAFGRIFSKETFGPTTMMTGNVTQFALDIRTICNSGFQNQEAKMNIGKGLITLGGFLCGCTLGALGAKFFGLISLFIPGIVLLFCYLSSLHLPSVYVFGGRGEDRPVK